MSQLESTAPLLTSRRNRERTTPTPNNANSSAAGRYEIRKTDQTTQNGRRTRLSRFTNPFIKLAAPISAAYSTSTHATRRFWEWSWTTETFSFVFSVLTLAGLVATLSALQGKPLPKWPQLITINSVLSLFSLLMRTGVSVVLAEGMSATRPLCQNAKYPRPTYHVITLNWSTWSCARLGVILSKNRYQSIEVAVVSQDADVGRR
jgi:hypothetical protein